MAGSPNGKQRKYPVAIRRALAIAAEFIDLEVENRSAARWPKSHPYMREALRAQWAVYKALGVVNAK